MMCFILAMARNPAVQRRAQTELDLAVPDGRLPILSDFVDLPYTAAIVKETLRWKPVVPLGELSYAKISHLVVLFVIRQPSPDKRARRTLTKVGLLTVSLYIGLIVSLQACTYQRTRLSSRTSGTFCDEMRGLL
jgi:hypothetical protein